MSEDLSNKTLATLLVLSIIVTLTGTLIFLSRNGSITGYQAFNSSASDIAIARINITGYVSLNWTTDYLDWGTGEAAVDYCELNTKDGIVDVANCTGFNSVTVPLTLENTGTKRLKVNVTCDMDAANFIGGTNPLFQWWWSENEAGSCTVATGPASGYGLLQNDTWYNITANASVLICPYFQFVAANDALDMDLRVVIPTDAYPGERNATFTAYGELAKN
jgi:hypothetical protein